MTYLFQLLLVVLFLFVTFFPLRVIFSFVVFWKFFKGLNWQRKRKINNEEVCRLELANFLKEKELTAVIHDWDEKWDNMVKKKDKVEFEHKLTEYFQSVVKIYFPKDILQLCETPNKLVEYFGYTQTTIRLPKNDRNELPRMTNPKIKKKSTPLHYHLHNFIMSRIPSDYYRIRNPSLAVDVDPDSGWLKVSHKTFKRVTSMRQGLNFGQADQQPNVAHVFASVLEPVEE